MRSQFGGSDQIEIWDPAKPDQQAQPASPLLVLWAPHQSERMQLSSSGLLALEAWGGDAHVSGVCGRGLSM